jgi:hypothetical protein
MIIPSLKVTVPIMVGKAGIWQPSETSSCMWETWLRISFAGTILWQWAEMQVYPTLMEREKYLTPVLPSCHPSFSVGAVPYQIGGLLESFPLPHCRIAPPCA